MSHGFLRAKHVIKSANTRNHSQVCLFWTTENEQLFTGILKTLMTNSG